MMSLVNSRALPVGQFKIKSRTESSVCLKKVYSSIVVLIGLVSLYDAFLVYQYRQVIDEQNPFCAWLISLEPDCVSLFLAGKVLGTLSVMAILFFLFRHWSRLAVPVAASLMVFQIGLLGYLHGSDGRRASVTQIAMLSSDTFAPLTSVTSEAASAGKAKHISGKSKITQPGEFSTTVQQQWFTKSERRRLRSQRLKAKVQKKQVNPKNGNAKTKNTRSKERVLHLGSR
jgi:hypothetical protein